MLLGIVPDRLFPLTSLAKKKVLSPEKIEIKSENNSTGIHKQAG
jgi:hypothetical protein